MEPQLVVSALRATTSPGNQVDATAYLNHCSATIGFPLILVDILRDPNQELALRQAAVIFLKNLITQAWFVEESAKDVVTQISEQDKVVVRGQIVDLIVEMPDPIRVQLCLCIQSMLRHDFPDKWSTQTGENIVEVVSRLLISNQGEKYLAGLYITYRLTKIFEYKRQNDKGPFIRAMQQILPILFNLIKQLMQHPSQESCLLQKLILKIFYCLVQFSLSPDVFTVESFQGWFEVFITIINREVPSEVDQLDDDEKENTVYWKCKKWALKIVSRIFERYGSKGHVEKTYEKFAEYYTNHLASHAITSVMQILSNHVSDVYVSERVLYLSIEHLAESLSHAQIWKAVKDHLMAMFTTVLFPLMKHSDEDEDLWSDDPEVYLREKMDCWEEIHSPASAAIKFIQAATKRKGVLQPILAFVIHKLDDTNADPRDVDGALHVIASLSDFLCGDKRYKKDVEKLLHVHVRPRITSSTRYIRARALRAINEASNAPIRSREFLNELAELITQRLQDTKEELPVKFEAALAIQALIGHQEDIHQFIRPRIPVLLTETLRLLHQVQLEDLPLVVESLIENFQEDIVPVAELIVEELIKIFNHLTAEDEDGTSDESGITVMGVLSTLLTILELIEDHPDIVARVELMVHGLIVRILDVSASDYFDECTSLTEALITKKISPHMWQIFDQMCTVFDIEKSMFFGDAMPCFYRFITVDTDAFLADQERVRKMLNMCSQVMHDKGCGDDIRAGAAKILEVMLTQCQGRLDNYVGDIVTLLMQYLSQSQSFEEFEIQLVVTLLSAFVCSSQLFLSTIAHLGPHQQMNLAWLFERVFNGYKSFHGIHDRAVILHACILAIRLPTENRPPRFTDPGETLKLFMDLFDNIRRCRIAIAKNDRDSDESENSDEEEDESDSKRNISADLDDSDDDLTDGDREYLSRLNEENSDSDDSEARHSFVEKTELEDYTTIFDEEDAKLNVYDQFVSLLEELEAREPEYYRELIRHVSSEKKQEFEQLIELCRREREHFRSKQVQAQGGYRFADVPIQFNFA